MWIILPGLYLGDESDASNGDALEFLGVSHVLNCAAEVRAPRFPGIRYLHLNLADPDPRFASCIPEICAFIEEGRRCGGVLVHCRMGRNRSASAVIASLCSQGASLDEALQTLEDRLSEVGVSFLLPAQEFLDQIEEHFGEPA